MVRGAGRRQQDAQLLCRADDGRHARRLGTAVPEGGSASVEAQAETEMSGHAARAARSIERRKVSRKTAGDGKLEITKGAAGRLESLGSRFTVRVNDHDGEGTLGSMPCTCRGMDAP